jgi:alpha-N-arabinofuranosidase
MRDFGGLQLFLIACGPRANNADWSHRFFTKLGNYRRMQGYAAHYYCGTAGRATEYTTDEWYHLIHRSLAMETLIKQQRAIMDGFDPERRIGLIVDEWGTWHPPTLGRHPRHLWQQNTLRDALVAAATLDIFNRHADKVVMGNIAQTINVLQAMILTDGDRMTTTPTYHVYNIYQGHQGGRSLRPVFDADPISFKAGPDERRLFGLDGSASLKGNVLTLSVVNPHATSSSEAVIELRGGECKEASVTTLTHTDIHAHNTFDAPDVVRPITFALEARGREWRHTFAPASVTVFRITL